jgi:hypothetical protein
MPYVLQTGYEPVAGLGDDIPKSTYDVPDEGLGMTVIKTTWLVALIGLPTLAAIYFGRKLNKAGIPLLKSAA